jgi:hypothetical protein
MSKIPSEDVSPVQFRRVNGVLYFDQLNNPSPGCCRVNNVSDSDWTLAEVTPSRRDFRPPLVSYQKGILNRRTQREVFAFLVKGKRLLTFFRRKQPWLS